VSYAIGVTNGREKAFFLDLGFWIFDPFCYHNLVDRKLKKLLSCIAVLAILAIMSGTSFAQVTPLQDLAPEVLAARATNDAAAVGVYRQGLASILGYLDTNPQVLIPDNPDLPSRAQKEELWRTWQSYLDYHLALESIRQYYSNYWRLRDGASRKKAFRVLYASFLAQYRFALQFLDRTDQHPLDDKILNDPVPEMGLPSGTYADFKFRYLSVLRAGEFASLQVIDSTFQKETGKLSSGMEEDSSVIWEMGKGRGEKLTLKNAVQVVKNQGFKAWFPVQAGVSQLMGDIKVQRQGQFLITHDQVRELIPDLLPGDVIITRREWFLSNVGLPGFWSHASMYIGTLEERKRFFSGDDVAEWVKSEGGVGGDLEALLMEKYPVAYARFSEPDEAGHERRVIEAVGEGVIFTTAEHAIGADSIAILRPRLSALEKVKAIVRSFHYSGRPYDFNFDFTTDSSLVCSELIYKSYEPSNKMKGLKLPLVKVAGRPVTPPNNIARMFDEEYGFDKQQFELVIFLDGFEKSGKAVRGDLEEFRKSWKRPNWHILVQK
jgi:hypothetical protein